MPKAVRCAVGFRSCRPPFTNMSNVSTLEPLRLTRAEASDAASYARDQIVKFRRGNREQRLSRGRACLIDCVDVEAGTVSLAMPQGKCIAWSPARWGGDQTEAFFQVEREFRRGDRGSSPATTGVRGD